MAAFYTRGGLTLTNNLLHTGMSRVKMNGGLAPPPLTSPRSAVIFVEKAAAACAAPALKYFCSILHHNLAFTQNLGQTPLQLEVKALNDVGSVAQSTLCPSFQAIEYSCPEFGSLIFAIVSQ